MGGSQCSVLRTKPWKTWPSASHDQRPWTSLGVWEIEVERRANEGWGMELNEHPSGLGLTIGNITEGLALDRWNRESKWVQPGDVIVGCEPDVGVAPMLQRLRTAQRVRFTILRWFGDPSCVRFEVGGPEGSVSTNGASEHVLGERSVKVRAKVSHPFFRHCRVF